MNISSGTKLIKQWSPLPPFPLQTPILYIIETKSGYVFQTLNSDTWCETMRLNIEGFVTAKAALVFIQKMQPLWFRVQILSLQKQPEHKCAYHKPGNSGFVTAKSSPSQLGLSPWLHINQDMNFLDQKT